jgi:DNA-binding transcriptional ArsR family regulator
MSGPFEQLAGLDKLIHEPARLAICTALASCDHADFLYLLRLTGLSKGNLSAHLAKLEAGGIVAIDKRFEGRIPRTSVALTPAGRDAITAYWQQLDTARAAGSDYPHPDDNRTEHGNDDQQAPPS